MQNRLSRDDYYLLFNKIRATSCALVSDVLTPEEATSFISRGVNRFDVAFAVVATRAGVDKLIGAMKGGGLENWMFLNPYDTVAKKSKRRGGKWCAVRLIHNNKIGKRDDPHLFVEQSDFYDMTVVMSCNQWSLEKLETARDLLFGEKIAAGFSGDMECSDIDELLNAFSRVPASIDASKQLYEAFMRVGTEMVEKFGPEGKDVVRKVMAHAWKRFSINSQL